jgi:DNA repair ATPase RecN
MKKCLIPLFIGCLLLLPRPHATAQVQELEQLALDIEKLAQMKSILSEMYKGYKVLTTGYGAIKAVAQGNFNLHNAFLSSLMSVSPAVKNYVRIVDIVTAQETLISEYKTTLKNYTASGGFTATELNYITGVYANLFNRSVDNLSELAIVLTDSKLRMSDAERLAAIDHIYADMQDKLTFLRAFNAKAGALGAQRAHDLQDNINLQSLYGQ